MMGSPECASCPCLAAHPRGLPAFGQGWSTSTTGPTISPRTSSRPSRRTPAPRSTTRPTISTRSSTPSSGPAGRATTSWCPRPRPSSYASSRPTSTGRSTRPSSRTSGTSIPRSWRALAKYDPGNAHGLPWMWGTTGIGYNVAAIKKRLPDAPVDLLKHVFDPAVVVQVRRLRRDDPRQRHRRAAGGTEISRPRSRFEEDRGSRQGGRRREGGAALHPQVPFVGVHQRAGRRQHLPGLRLSPATSSRPATGPPRPRTSATSPTPSRAKARCSGSTSRPSPRMRPTPTTPSASSTSCSSPRSPRRRASSPATPTPTRRRPRCCPRTISGNPLIYPPADVRAKFYTITAGNADQTRERTRLWTMVKTGR